MVKVRLRDKLLLELRVLCLWPSGRPLTDPTPMICLVPQLYWSSSEALVPALLMAALISLCESYKLPQLLKKGKEVVEPEDPQVWQTCSDQELKEVLLELPIPVPFKT
jgi:hypothetical protein